MRRLEESVTLCKILDCLSFGVELMFKNHILAQVIYIKIVPKIFQKYYIFCISDYRQLNRAVDRPLVEVVDSDLRRVKFFKVLELLSTVHLTCRKLKL